MKKHIGHFFIFIAGATIPMAIQSGGVDGKFTAIAMVIAAGSLSFLMSKDLWP